LKNPADFSAILETLTRHQVDFVLIGGLAAALHGCPVPTYDVDIVCDRQESNLLRLEAALGELDAVFANDLAGRRLAPARTHLLADGPKLFMTRFGRLDLLGQVNPEIDWESLRRRSNVAEVNQLSVRVVSLECLIEIKEWLVGQQLGERGPRDQLHLHHLRAIAARKKV